MTFEIPKIKINKFRDILSKPEIDKFSRETIDGVKIDMTIHQDDTGKYFLFHGFIQVYGWTVCSQKAFQILGNMEIYTAHELYEAMRGRKVEELAEELANSHSEAVTLAWS